MNENTDIATTAAKIVSVLFHPLFLVFYGTLVILYTPAILYLPYPGIKRMLLIVVLSNNVAIPALIIYLLRSRNLISSYQMEKRSERIIPLLTTSLLYFITTLMLFRLRIPDAIKDYLFAAGCVVFISALVTFRWKVSIHAAGAGAMVITIILLSLKMHAPMPLLVTGFILLAGLIMSARLQLNAHTPAQVYTGFATGAAVMGAVLVL